ncbi:MAG: nucleotidyltransferase domain-containing protein [Bdellovibrio sp.]|nr:MAG: nucleotidyltransferase domain-containing protein [Bdellovibrio sp.]
MKFGLSDDQYNYILKNVVEPLRKQGAEVWCFGSRARGDYQKFSDVDLMVVAEKDLTQIIGETLEPLSKENFPLKVDLVVYDELAESFKPFYEDEKKRF